MKEDKYKEILSHLNIPFYTFCNATIQKFDKYMDAEPIILPHYLIKSLARWGFRDCKKLWNYCRKYKIPLDEYLLIFSLLIPQNCP